MIDKTLLLAQIERNAATQPEPEVVAGDYVSLKASRIMGYVQRVEGDTLHVYFARGTILRVARSEVRNFGGASFCWQHKLAEEADDRREDRERSAPRLGRGPA